MKKVPVWGWIFFVGCGRIYLPFLVFDPPDPPAVDSGLWVVGEMATIPGQYPGENGLGGGITGQGVHQSRRFRAELMGSLWAGAYRFTDSAFTGIGPFLSQMGMARASLLIPMEGFFMEIGGASGLVAQEAGPSEVTILPAWGAGGLHVGLGVPGKLWFRASYGFAYTGISLTLATGSKGWVGASMILWNNKLETLGIRIGIARKISMKKEES